MLLWQTDSDGKISQNLARGHVIFAYGLRKLLTFAAIALCPLWAGFFFSYVLLNQLIGT